MPEKTDQQLKAEIRALHHRLGMTGKQSDKALKRCRSLEAHLRGCERKYGRLQNDLERRHRQRIPAQFTEAGRVRHREALHDAACERRDRRKTMSLGQRLDAALEQARLCTGVSAGAIEKGSAHAHPESQEPPRFAGAQYTASEDAVYDTFVSRATALIERLEREVGAGELVVAEAA